MEKQLKENSIQIHICKGKVGTINLLIHNNNIFEQEVIFALDETQTTAQFLVMWLVTRSKKVFEIMPISNIEMKISKDCMKIYEKEFNLYATIIGRTNNYLKKDIVSNLAKTKKNNVLIFEVKNQRYETLIKRIEHDVDRRVYKLYEPINFNGKTRTMEQKELKYDIDILLEFIKNNQIKIVAVVNMDPLMRYMFKEGINIFTLLEKAGCTLLNIQNDPSELNMSNYLQRDLMYSEWTEFVNMGILSKHYDIDASQKIVYSPIMQDYTANRYWPIDISEKQKIVVLSNSRYENIISEEENITTLLNQFNEPFIELPIWYLSICKTIDNDKELKLSEKTIKRYLFHWLFYNSAQYLKHRIIKEVEDDFDINVYGDIGWQQICPRSYCGYLEIGEYRKLYNSSDVLFLLLNFGFTYLDHSGPVYDMVKYGSHWINVPSICRTGELEDLGKLEYNSTSQLRQVISEYSDRRKQSISSLSALRQIYQSATDSLVDEIMINKKVPYDSLFLKSYEEHNRLINVKTNNYIIKNHEMLTQMVYS